MDRRLTSPGQDQVGLTVLDHLRRPDDRMRASRAGTDNPDGRRSNTEVPRHSRRRRMRRRVCEGIAWLDAASSLPLVDLGQPQHAPLAAADDDGRTAALSNC